MPIRPSSRHRPPGFTLIEMMMAIAMGSIIILIATSGVRAASETMTLVNRLSFQNHLLREGFFAACNEVDFWTQVDNPGYPDQQSSRKMSPTVAGAGRPFTPFKLTWSAGLIKDPYNGGLSERQTGWSPSPMAWAAFDPRTWARFNAAERAQSASGTQSSDGRWGDYSLFEGLNPATPPPQTLPWNPEYARSWYANQVKGLVDALGFYGTYDYLPSNILWSYHGYAPKGANGDISPGGLTVAMMASGGWFNCGDGPQYFSRGRYRATRCASVPLPDPQNETVMNGLLSNANSYPAFCHAGTIDAFRTYWNVGEGIDSLPSSADRMLTLSNYLAFTNFDENLMQIHPAEWPSMVIQVHRYVKNSRMIQLCLLDIFDPQSGAHTSLPFSCCGTSLRGARQQRASSLVNGGWSTYNNTDPYQIILGPTLDWNSTRTITR